LQAEAAKNVTGELANWLTHGLGLALSLAAAPLLIVLAAIHGTAWHIVGVSIYGATLIALYAASTAYHACKAPRVRDVLRVLDHSAIYLLIAGTYTPFALVNMRGPWGWTLLGLVWGIAIFGIAWKIVAGARYPAVSLASYLVMGWLVIIAIKPLTASVALGGLLWLAAGGLAYTLGTLFYGMKKLPYHHAVWHVLVMVGSVCHYFAVVGYVLP
jgi:hemolysin III